MGSLRELIKGDWSREGIKSALSLSYLRRTAVPLWNGLRIVWKLVNDKGVLAHASVCGYATILSLVPVIAISLSILSAFTSQDTTLNGSGKQESFSNQVFDFFFEHFVPGVADGAREELAKAKQSTLEFIQKTAALRFISIILLLLASVSLFNSIEHAFNEIWSVRYRRSLFARFLAFWLLLTLTPLLLGLSYYYTSQFLNSEAIAKFKAGAWSNWVLQHGISYIFTLSAFLFANRYLPNSSVRLLPALVGSALSGIMWEAAKVAFDIYITFALKRQGYYSVFGTVVAVPIFIIWLYYSYLCFLLGPVIATTIQNYDLHRSRFRRRIKGTAHRPLHSLRIFLDICRYFREEKGGMSIPSMEDRSGWSTGRIRRCLRDLEQARLIHQDVRKVLYYPSADPDSLNVSEVVERLIGFDTPTPPAPGKLEEAWELSLRRMLFQDDDLSVTRLLSAGEP